MIDINDSLAYRIHRFARLLRKHFLFLAAERGMDLTPEQWFVLNKLRREDGRSQSDLMDEIFSDRPNLTRMLAKMADKGLVRRRADPEDGRRMLVFLTKKGRQVHDAFAQSAEAARTELFAGLAQADVEAVERVLAQMESNMRFG